MSSPLIIRLYLYLFSPTLVFFCRRRPISHQVQSLLLSPRFRELRPWHPHNFLAEFQNRLHCNLLRNRILTLQHICFHLFKPRLLHRRIQRWLLPAPVQLPLGLTPGDPSKYPVLEPLQGQAHEGGHHPHIRNKK